MPDNYGIPVVFCTVRGPSGQSLENYDRFDVSNTASIGLGMDALESVACDFSMAPGGQAYEDPGFPTQGLVPGDNATPVAGEAGLQDQGFPPPSSPMGDQATDPLAEGLPLDVIADDGGEDGPASAALIEDGNVGLHIFKYQCPDEFAGDTADYASLAGACGETIPDVDFTILVNGALVASLTTSGSPAYIFSPDLPAGDMTIQEYVPQGFGAPVVYCYVVRDGQVVCDWVQYPVDGNSVQIPGLTTPDITYCGWFNIPTDASGEIMIYVNGCPENYDIYSKSPEELNADCTGQFEGTEFVLEHPTDGNSSAFATGLSLASFTNIAPGQVRLREVMPAGYGVPVVFCQVSGPNGQTTEQYDQYDVSNNASIGLGMDELEFVGCDFFQAQGGLPGGDIQPVDIQDLLPSDPTSDDSGEDPPSATPQSLPQG